MDQLDKILRIYVRWLLYIRIPMNGRKETEKLYAIENGITSFQECVYLCI